MNTKKIIDKLNSKTRAVFLTHAQGFDGLSDELLSELEMRKIPLIEDVCESHGVTHNGIKAGSIGWISNFSFYYAHHMSTIEGGMICTNDDAVYEEVRMLRSHGMIREVNSQNLRSDWIKNHPDLNPDFIFAVPGYNVRNTEIGGILGISQLKRLDKAIELRTRNLEHFLKKINSDKYFVDFKIEGSSNYAFNLILKNKDDKLVIRLMSKLESEGVEYRRGSAGGGNQLRQPYLKGIVPEYHYKDFLETDHIHFYGFYIGNFPDLAIGEVNAICEIINSV